MADRLTDEQIRHTPNEALLAEATKIKEERETLKGRLEKLDATRSEVNSAVYQRVRSDYVAKLNQTAERLTGLRKGLEDEQKILVEKKIAIEQALQKAKETIEESALRHALGEFSSPQHETVVRQESGESKRLEAAAREIQASLDRTGKIFEGEDWKAPPAAPRPKAPGPLAPGPLAPSPEPGTMKFREAELAEKSETTAPKIPQLLIMENGKVVQTVTIDKTIQIGRSPANDVVLKEPKVSRKHAEIHRAGGKYILLDLESSNGTTIAGKKIAEQVLQPDDEITIGNTKMVFKSL